MVRNGCLVLASANTPGCHHGSTSFVQDTIDAAREFRIAHEVLRADEIGRRYPQFRLLGDEVGYFEPGAGFLRPEACIEAQLTLAQEAGAQIFNDEVALDIYQRPSKVEIRTSKAIYSAKKVIVTPGAWIPRLLGERLRAFFQGLSPDAVLVSRGKRTELFEPRNFPVFIWITGNQPRDMMYGFPQIDANGGVKIATEQYEATVDPDAVPRNVDPADVAALYDEYIAPRFPASRPTACAAQPAFTPSPLTRSSSSTISPAPTMWYLRRRAPATASNTRRQLEKRWPSRHWGCQVRLICRRSAKEIQRRVEQTSETVS